MKLLSILFLMTLTVACGDETIEKGDEEQALTGGKSDSFYHPTEHGAINFGVASQATVGEDTGFHAWTFTLTDDAKVVLKTEVSRNLDTVMYLYKRDNTEDSWGRYIKKNDDHARNIWSQITLSGEAAEYRVIVKPFKKALRGSFSLLAECDGAGCVSDNPNPGQCVADEFNSPEGLGWTDSCGTKIMDLVRSPSVSTSSGSIRVDDRCELGGVEQLAVMHYFDYFEDYGYGSIEEMFDYDGEGIDVEFSHTTYQGGHKVDVDTGGDEDGMSLFYDNDMKLLALYQHNQSPDVQFYCGETGDTTDENEPWAECMSPILFETPTSTDTAVNTLSGTDTLENIVELDILGITDLESNYFGTYEQQLEEDTQIDYEYAQYDSYSNKIGVLTLSFGTSDPITYTAYSDHIGVMYTRTRAGVTNFSCEK